MTALNVTQTDRTTAEERFQRSHELGRCELVSGELIRKTPSGGKHGEITLSIGAPLRPHVRQQYLGKASGGGGGWCRR